MISNNEFTMLLKNRPDIAKLFMDFDPPKQFEDLISIKSTISDAEYARCLRCLFQDDTQGVSIEQLRKAFENIKKTDLMSDDEMKKYLELPDIIDIYRGTTLKENSPRLSWSLDKTIANNFYQGRMFHAKINRDSIIAFFSEKTDEYEVIAYVNEYDLLT